MKLEYTAPPIESAELYGAGGGVTSPYDSPALTDVFVLHLKLGENPFRRARITLSVEEADQLLSDISLWVANRELKAMRAEKKGES